MLFRPSQRRSSRRSANHHSEWLGRPVGTPSRRYPYALYIEPARVLVGGRLLGPGQGTGAPEQSAASASSASTHCAVNHLSTPIRIKPTQKKWSSAKSAARSVHLPDHLVQDQIRAEADGGSLLAARPPASPGSALSPRLGPARGSDSHPAPAPLAKKYRPSVQSIARSLVATAVPALPEACRLPLSRVIARCDVPALVRVVRWNLRRRAGVIGSGCKAA